MLQTFVTKTRNILIDWLIAFLVIVFILWFAFTLPTLPTNKLSTNDNAISIDPASLQYHVESLSYRFAPRAIGYGNLKATGTYIHKAFSHLGNAEYQSYWTLMKRYRNVVLKLGPDTEEILVIGAHYDAKDDSLDIDGNASGVASLIELAKKLSENEEKLSIGVQLVAYPLSQKKSVTIENMGSYRHARHLKESGRSVKFMLSLDSVGSYTNESKSQKYPYKFMSHVYPDKGNYISLVGRVQDYSDILKLKNSFKRASDLPMHSFYAPSSYISNSVDHLNYQKYGFPAMMVTDTDENRNIGDIKKTVVDRLDFTKMAMLVEGLYQVVLDNESTQIGPELAENDSTSDILYEVQ